MQAPGGAIKLRLQQETIRELREELGGESFRAIERKLHAYAIVSRSGWVITLAYPRKGRARR